MVEAETSPGVASNNEALADAAESISHFWSSEGDYPGDAVWIRSYSYEGSYGGSQPIGDVLIARNGQDVSSITEGIGDIVYANGDEVFLPEDLPEE